MVPLGAGQLEALCTSLQIGILSLEASSAERENIVWQACCYSPTENRKLNSYRPWAAWRIKTPQITNQHLESRGIERSGERKRISCLASRKLTSRQLTTRNQAAIRPTLQIGILSLEASSAEREYCLTGIQLLTN